MAQGILATNNTLVDKIGLFTTGACVLHCLALPILSFTLLSESLLFNDEVVHSIMAVSAVITIGFSSIKNYPKHRSKKTIFIGMLGALVVVSTALFHAFSHGESHGHSHEEGHFFLVEESLTVIGGLLILAFHYFTIAKLRGNKGDDCEVC
ncbi:MerC domain-containing protein [bacterium]|nr:MerC domain-containing protein [bacterium]